MPTAFDPTRAVLQFRRRLPHMRQEGAVYFVTFRLADSVPQEKLRQWYLQQQADLRRHGPSDQVTNHLHRQVGRWLDRGIGPCLLQDPRLARIVADVLLHFDAQRYLLDDYVIMPNHVHALVHPLTAEHDLSAILHSWKRHSAREVNRMLRQAGPFWQAESFDHIVRNSEDLERFRNYIRRNPAQLPPGRLALPGSGSFAQTTGL